MTSADAGGGRSGSIEANGSIATSAVRNCPGVEIPIATVVLTSITRIPPPTAIDARTPALVTVGVFNFPETIPLNPWKAALNRSNLSFTFICIHDRIRHILKRKRMRSKGNPHEDIKGAGCKQYRRT